MTAYQSCPTLCRLSSCFSIVTESWGYEKEVAPSLTMCARKSVSLQ